MTANLVAILALWGMGLAFLMLRRPFVTAMIDAQLAEIRMVAYELERLAVEGKIDRESAFYEVFRSTALQLASIRADQFPSLPVLAFAVGVAMATDKPKTRRRSQEAWWEASGRYREYEQLPVRLLLAMASTLKYRSVLLWLIGHIVTVAATTMTQANALARLFRALVGVFDTVLAEPRLNLRLHT